MGIEVIWVRWQAKFLNFRNFGARPSGRLPLRPGREPINSEWSTDVRFGAHNGLKSDIAPCPKSAMNGLMHCSKSGLLVRRHSCAPLNLAFRLPHVSAVATDICTHRQRTFALHCFRFCFLLASGSPESHTFFSSATTRRSKCSRGLVLIASSKPINICQMRAIQVSRLVNWVFSFIMCSMFDLLPRGHPPDRNQGIRKPTFLRLFSMPPKVPIAVRAGSAKTTDLDVMTNLQYLAPNRLRARCAHTCANPPSTNSSAPAT